MIRRLVALLVVVCMIAPAAAAPRKVLVLPLDGTAPADTRKKLSASFQKMARVLDGDVQAGLTSLGDTATALGCDAKTPACIENVRATLGVDELVYGTADETDGTITVVAKRYRKGKPVREMTVGIASSDPPTKIEPALLPVFGEEPLPTDPNTTTNPNTQTDPVVPDPNAKPPGGEPVGPEQPTGSNTERNIWIGVTSGGGLLFLVGLGLWASKRSIQDDIDKAPTSTTADFERLRDLEDKASSRGWAGNIFVLAGLAVAGYGGYRLWKHLKTRNVTVTPTPVEGGAAVTFTFVGDGW